MCRNIKPLFNFDPPVTDEEIRAASLQFVRKVSGFTKPSKANEAAFRKCDVVIRGGPRFTKPSKANEAAFLAAVDEIATISHKLLHALETNASPKNRAEETAKARARSALRFRA